MSGSLGSLPTGRRGQAAALGLLAVAALVVWTVVVAPLLGWYAARETELADRRALLAHATGLAEALPALRQEAGAAVAEAPSRALIEGDSDAIAAASLQGLVQDMASHAGAPLTSAEALPAEQQGGFRRIGLRVALSTDWPVLIALLQAMENSRYRLLIDDVQLHATARVGAGPQAGSTPLEAGFVVLGFRAGAPASAAHAVPMRADVTP